MLAQSHLSLSIRSKNTNNKISHLNPSQKHSDGHGTVELHLPEAQELKVGEDVRVFEQVVEHAVDGLQAVQIEGNTDDGDDDDQDVQNVPEALEVRQLMLLDLILIKAYIY